jgi:hypothetical protein
VEGEELCVLGCSSLEWSLHLAELGEGRKMWVLVKIPLTLAYITEFQ